MNQTIRILHVANVALGNPYTGIPLELCHECYHRFPEVFDDLFAYVRQEGIDLVLFAGNLYSHYLTSADTAHLIRNIKEAAPCRFVIAPGAEDHYANDSLYASGRLPENAYIFETDTLEHFDFDDIGTTVYGWAVQEHRRATSPLAGSSVTDPARINLLVGSCDMEARTLFISATKQEVAAFGADYAAFAHGPATEVLTAGRTRYAHGGFLEGRGFDESGVGGFLRVDITLTDEERTVDTRFVPISRHRFETVTMDVTGVASEDEVDARITNLIAEEGFGPDTSLRVILEGELHPTVILRNDDGNRTDFPLYSIDLIDHTLPIFDAERLEHDMTIRGELYRSLKKRLLSATGDERIAYAQALRAALAALDSRDITGI